ncbi:MFS transporter [Mangrovihabitans endophyticus]|uniref:MFS transporter n=1 Tax=Mangrovihabitans endophyticus TaxID=1751298 RepID=A0A8J3FL50_9ACTN|nr:MFS transporter [Mangrovihabitans endophyticus]GGK74705.1 MFS transporter [Mangrovihabitans endophyticus]
MSGAEADPGTARRVAEQRYAWRVLSLVCLAAFMTGVNNSSITIALPTIVRHFAASAFEANWVLLSFMLTSTVLMIFFGRLADLLGRREMYLAGMVLFTVTSVAAGFAPTVWFLIGCRVLQATAGAMLVTNSAALVSGAFPRRMLGQGLGIYLSSFGLAQLVGPTLGGVIATGVGWRWNFWLNAPLGVACLLWGMRVLERVPRRGGAARLDPVGNLLVLVGLGSLLLALSEVTALGWTSPLVLGGLCVFALAVPAFLLVESRTAHPVVDLATFADPVVGLGVLAGFLAMMSRFAVVLLMGLYFQAVRGDTPAEAGVKILPLAVASIVTSPSVGLMLRYTAARTVAVASNAVSALGLLVLTASLSATTPYWLIVVACVVMGLGSGSFIPANSTAMLTGVPSERLGITNAVRTMAQSAGGVMSTAVALTIISAPLPVEYQEEIFHGTLSRVSRDAVPELVTGYRWALGLMVVLSLLALATSLVGRRVNGPADPRARLLPASTVDSAVEE